VKVQGLDLTALRPTWGSLPTEIQLRILGMANPVDVLMNIPAVDRKARWLAAGLNGKVEMSNQLGPNGRPLTVQAKEELLVRMWKRFPKLKGQETFGLDLLSVAKKHNLLWKVDELNLAARPELEAWAKKVQDAGGVIKWANRRRDAAP